MPIILILKTGAPFDSLLGHGVRHKPRTTTSERHSDTSFPARVWLTEAQKLVLCKHDDEHAKLSLRALCKWASSTFQIRHNPLHAALLMLLKKRTNPVRKTNHCVYCPALEDAFVRWINRCELLQTPVFMWATMRGKSENIKSALVRDDAYVRNVKLEGMVFSDGWLQKARSDMG